MNQNNDISNTSKQDILTVDLKKFLFKMLKYWWVFVICTALGYALGYFYLRYATYQYSTSAVLMIKDTGKSGSISEANILGQFSSGAASMDNEIQILNSLPLMEKVVERLNLRVSYHRIGQIKEGEMYDRSSFILDSFEFNKPIGFGLNYYIELDDYETFKLKYNEDDEDGMTCYFGVPFETRHGRFLIRLSPSNSIIKGLYRLNIASPMGVARRYKSRLTSERIGDPRTSSVLNIGMVDPVAKKTADIVNTLIEVYNEEEIKDENRVLRNTLEFIDDRVVYLINELDSVEGGIQQFKSANQIITADASASMSYTLGEIRNSINRMSSFEVQRDILSSLENFLNDTSSDFQLIPANLIAESPVLSNHVSTYNELVIRNNVMSETATKENPARIQLESQIIEYRRLIKETIINLKEGLQIPINEIEDNIDDLKKSMGRVPGLEKKLIEQMRTQSVKENLFLYLLQKREETALAEAVATAKTRILDYARVPSFPNYPRKKFIYMISMMLGFLVPLLLMVLYGLLDNKIRSEDGIKALTDVPILGSIPLGKKKDHVVVKKGSRSAINEMFRLIRTNLSFLSQNEKARSILVTSSVSGEGKTFIAINLGITLSLASKKTIVIGLDLRKPKMSQYLNEANDSTNGLTNYLIGQKEVSQIIQKSDLSPHLDYISAGPPPPNPSELIMDDRMKMLIDQLKNEYDFIVIDTPPIGLVSDALLLRKFVDTLLVVVRQNVTKKQMVRNLQELKSRGDMDQSYIIFNGVKKGTSYYGYGGYSYGYHQNYYVEDEK